MSAHTPGPWQQRRGTTRTHDVTAGDYDIVARLYPSKARPEVEANARLIAAAPDLLAFAEAVAEYAEYHDDEESYENLRGVLSRLEARARAAIAKARGR